MKLRKPSYYDRFHCIGSACSDTCCANWEIEVDEESAGRYAALTGAIGERMKHNLVIEENEAYFAMNETRRCPFLNRENLCDLILECGEEILCDGLAIIPKSDWGSVAKKRRGCCLRRKNH